MIIAKPDLGGDISDQPERKLARIADRLHFYRRLEKAIVQQRARLRTALRTIRKGQKVRLRIATFNTVYRPGLGPIKQEGWSRLDEEGLEMKQGEIDSSLADDTIEKSKAVSVAASQ